MRCWFLWFGKISLEWCSNVNVGDNVVVESVAICLFSSSLSFAGSNEFDGKCWMIESIFLSDCSSFSLLPLILSSFGSIFLLLLCWNSNSWNWEFVSSFESAWLRCSSFSFSFSIDFSSIGSFFCCCCDFFFFFLLFRFLCAEESISHSAWYTVENRCRSFFLIIHFIPMIVNANTSSKREL